MKVLWTHNFNPDIPNAGRFMYLLADGLRREGVNIELMYLGSLGSVERIWKARNEVISKSKGFDITHSQFGSACALASAEAKSIRIVSLRGSDWHRYSSGNWSEYRHGLLATLFTKISLNAYDGVLVMSNRMADEVRLRLSKNVRLHILADPVDTSIFVPKDRLEARRELGIFDDVMPWVLFTTLSDKNPVKRPELARRAVELAADRVSGLKLKVATGLDHGKMPTFVAACNLVLCTSTHEGWPNSIKEALSCGLPFVSTDVSDLAEIAQFHPGCFVCPAEAHQLSDAIFKCLASSPGPGLRSVAESMNLEVSSRKLVSFYYDLLNSHKGVQ